MLRNVSARQLQLWYSTTTEPQIDRKSLLNFFVHLANPIFTQ